jgi:nucleoid-associated protein YejK
MKILEFEDYSEIIKISDKNRIKEWIKKYEKYFNFHNNSNFSDSIDEITQDCLDQLGFDEKKKESVKTYLESLYDLSDGLSVVMAPDPQFQYTNIDQVQRFQY